MIAKNLGTLRAILLLTVVATATGMSPTGQIVDPKLCPQTCEKGQACIKENVQCFAAPCSDFYTCAAKGGGGQIDPCAFTTCPAGYNCEARKLKGDQIDTLPSATCVPNCWAKKCSEEETCTSKPGPGGMEKAVCVSLSKCHPETQNTCTSSDKLCDLESFVCKMIDCQPQCVPSYVQQID